MDVRAELLRVEMKLGPVLVVGAAAGFVDWVVVAGAGLCAVGAGVEALGALATEPALLGVVEVVGAGGPTSSVASGVVAAGMEFV
jgi:hypothetical protein